MHKFFLKWIRKKRRSIFSTKQVMVVGTSGGSWQRIFHGYLSIYIFSIWESGLAPLPSNFWLRILLRSWSKILTTRPLLFSSFSSIWLSIIRVSNIEEQRTPPLFLLSSRNYNSDFTKSHFPIFLSLQPIQQIFTFVQKGRNCLYHQKKASNIF